MKFFALLAGILALAFLCFLPAHSFAADPGLAALETVCTEAEFAAPVVLPHIPALPEGAAILADVGVVQTSACACTATTASAPLGRVGTILRLPAAVLAARPARKILHLIFHRRR